MDAKGQTLTAATTAVGAHRAHDAWEPTDAALVAKLRAGDNAAGDELVRRYVEPLVRYLRRLAGSDHVAEELHQQTWLSVLEHGLHRFWEVPCMRFLSDSIKIASTVPRLPGGHSRLRAPSRSGFDSTSPF